MLTIHHLEKSQSERITWLCEELGLPYEQRLHKRDPVTILVPPGLKALHPQGTAPLIEDGGLMLAESGAIMQYILGKYGPGRLAPGPDDPAFAPYLYWFHFANGTLQPAMGRNMVMRWLDLPPDNPVLRRMRGRLEGAINQVEARLGETEHLAGAELTAADIMMVFSLTTMRIFMPLDLAPYPNILAYLQRIGARDGYRAAMHKGDPDMVPMLT